MSFLFQKETCFFPKKIPQLRVESFKIAHNPYFFHTFSTYLICSAVQPSAGHLRSCALEAPKSQVDSTHHFTPRFTRMFKTQRERLLMICRLLWNIMDLLTLISWPLITLWWTNIASLNPPTLKRRYTLKKVRFSLPCSFLLEGKHWKLRVGWC